MSCYSGLVSIITPCYNNALNIVDTMKSVINQSYTNWEMLCVDDGSSDDTRRIIRDFSETCPQIKLLIRERNPKGGSVCRNVGIENARGEYIMFLDADDLLDRDCLTNRVRKINDSNYDFVVFPFAVLSDGVIGKIAADSRISKHFLAFSSNHAVWQTSCPLYRASFVKQIGGFDESFPRLQDVEFGIRCLAESKDNYLVCLKGYKPDCYYRSSQSNMVFSKKYDLAFSTIPKLYQLVNNMYLKKYYSERDFSRVLLCIILSVIMISKTTSHGQTFETVMPDDYYYFLKLPERAALSSLKLLKPFGSMYFSMAHLYRYLLMRLFY